ncbi:SRPBCC family protein [Streptomyces sp. NPDC051561]|uniref:SRPBCC family protein n=1 Tax=Streptomyces sp. NPDC051561 TaxID=3365658 RepID=UPI00378EF33C
MPTQEFARSVTVARPTEDVFTHLARPESYVGLSPLVVAVRDVEVAREVGRDVAVARDAVRYVAVERFRLGPLRWDNPIRVTMTFPEPGRRIVSEVRSPGRVRLTSTVTLVPDGAGTRVSEAIWVAFPRPLRALVIGQAAKAQKYRLAELARRMDRSTTG